MTEENKTRGHGAGGANTNKNGLSYETLTDLNSEFLVTYGTNDSLEIVFNNDTNGYKLAYTKQNGFSKFILRKTFSNVVAEQIIWDKKKLGFPVPQRAWMEDREVALLFEDYVKNSKLIVSLGINKTPKRDSSTYWRLVNIAIWEKVFKVNNLQ